MSKPRRTPASKASAAPSKRHRHRARPTPRWLLKQTDLDEIARRRCLVVLSVLSGQRPVTDAIADAQISRQMYYQLEERALKAMLAALAPGASDETTSRGEGMTRRIAELEQKVEELERDKRRSERLLLLTRKLMKGPIKTGAGRPPKMAASPSSTSAGRRRSRASKTKSPAAAASVVSPSIPTPDGEVAP